VATPSALAPEDRTETARQTEREREGGGNRQNAQRVIEEGSKGGGEEGRNDNSGGRGEKTRGCVRRRERERERRREAGSSHVRLDSRRQNVNLALTHYARSGCVALGVRYRQHSVVYARRIALMRVGRVAGDDARERERRQPALFRARTGKPKRDRSRELAENRRRERVHLG